MTNSLYSKAGKRRELHNFTLKCFNEEIDYYAYEFLITENQRNYLLKKQILFSI